MPVLTAAYAVNVEIGRSHGKIPLPHSEVSELARRVERYRARWIAKDRFYSAEESSAPGLNRDRFKGCHQQEEKT